MKITIGKLTAGLVTGIAIAFVDVAKSWRV